MELCSSTFSLKFVRHSVFAEMSAKSTLSNMFKLFGVLFLARMITQHVALEKTWLGKQALAIMLPI